MESLVLPSLTPVLWSSPQLAPNSNPPKGFPREILVDLDTDASPLICSLICAECDMILRKPLQAPCGHRFCYSCFLYIASQTAEDSLTCQACVKETDNKDVKFSKTEVYPDNALARQEFSKISVRCCYKNCEWTGSLKNYETHFDVCPHAAFDCEICGDRIPIRITKHEHYDKEPAKHLEVLFKKVVGIEKNISEFKQSASVNVLPTEPTQQHQKPQRREDKLISNTSPYQTDGSQNAQYVEPNKGKATLTETEGCLIVLQKDILNISSQMEKMKKDQDASFRKLHAAESKIAELNKLLKAKDEEIQKLTNIIMSDPEPMSFDGSYVWKISNVKTRRQEAVTKTCTNWYSSAFYTSRTGYKLCLRIFLNGDGEGLSTHLSVFLVVLRGQYDAICKWPFRGRVTISLLSQNGESSPIQQTFEADPRSSSFMRPTTANNVASGFPHFTSLSTLDRPEYVVDDTMFLSVSVEVHT